MWVWLSASALATTVDEVPNPRPRASWIADVADVLPPEVEARLDARIDALHRDLDAEIAVVTIPSAGATSEKEFATSLFNTWGIGDAEADNGLLVLVVLDSHRIEMETGYGLEPLLPDGWLGRLQTDQMAPRFREGDYAAGVEAGISAVDARLRETPEETRSGGAGEPSAGVVGVDPALLDTVARDTARRRVREAAQFLVGLVVAVLVGVGLFAFGVLAVRRRERTCRGCKVYMPMLSESEDDQHLTDGQATEERVGSVDYQVHQCPKCGQTRTFVVHKFWTRYTRCPQCNHRTRTVERTTVRPATQLSAGVDEVSERCAHCDYRAKYTRRTPRLPPPPPVVVGGGSGMHGGFGGGGGGGGSFGGGRSGGGGAGSNW